MEEERIICGEVGSNIWNKRGDTRVDFNTEFLENLVDSDIISKSYLIRVYGKVKFSLRRETRANE